MGPSLPARFGARSNPASRPSVSSFNRIPAVGSVRETGPPSRAKRGPLGIWERIKRSHERRRGQHIPPLDSLEEAIDKRVAAGESEQSATLAVIEDFERSAATVNARTTPLVPASGIVVTGAGILAKDGGPEAVVSFVAMLFAFVGLAFLAASLFTHAGRPSVGIEPTRADIPFVHERLTKKEAQAQKGSFFSFVGFVILLIVIL